MSRRDDMYKKIGESIKGRAEELSQESKSNKENTDSINQNTDAINKNTESRKKNTEQTKKSITEKAREIQASKDASELQKIQAERILLLNESAKKYGTTVDKLTKGTNLLKLANSEDSKVNKEAIALIKQKITESKKAFDLKQKDKKEQDKLIEQHNKEISSLRELNENLRIKHQNSEDIARQRKKEIEEKKKEADRTKHLNNFRKQSIELINSERVAKKNAISQNKKEQSEIEKAEIKRIKELSQFKKQSIQTVKEEVVAKQKASAQNKKELDELRRTRIQREKNKEALRNLNAIAKRHNFTLKDLTGNLNLVKKAIRGDVRAMGQLRRAMRDATKQGTELNNRLGILSTRSQRNVGGAFSVLRSKILLASFGFSVTAGNVLKLVGAYGQQERAEKSLATALESTGYSARLTLSDLTKYASNLQKVTGVSDELTLESSALLATFTNISGDVFKATQSAIIDVTSAMNQGNISSETLKTTTIQLGKALNDPINGLSALNRVGIQFTFQQKELIQTLVNTGQISKAQSIILKELEKQFGGMGEALLDTTEGKLMAFNSAFGDMQERIGEFLQDFANPMIDFFTNLAKAIDVEKMKAFSASVATIGLVFAGAKIKVALKGLNGLALVFAKSSQFVKGISQVAVKSKGLATAIKLVRTSGLVLVGTQLLDFFNVFEDKDKKVEKSNNKLDEYYKLLTQMTDEGLIAKLKEEQKTLQDLETQIGDLTEQIEKKPEIPAPTIPEQPAVGSFTIQPFGEDNNNTFISKSNGQILVLNQNLEQSKEKVEELGVSFVAHGEQSGVIEKLNEKTKTSINLSNTEIHNKIAQAKTQQQLTQNNIDYIKSLQEGRKEKVPEEVAKLTKKYEDNLSALKETNKFTQELKKAEAELGLQNNELTDNIDKQSDAYKELAESIRQVVKEKELDKETDKIKGQLQDEIFNTMSVYADREIERLNEVRDADIEAVKETSEYKIAQKRGDNQLMKELEDNARRQSLPERVKAFRTKQTVTAGGILMDTAGAIMKVYRDFGFPAGLIPAGLVGGIGLAQLGQVYAQSPPKYATGGYVGGKSHSQGGTMIEAERGEFVMQRSAVNAVGVETLNRINSGQSGVVNINFSGNVLSADFIEDEAIPIIKDAVQRGADIGVN